jgi:hypothetical protein
MVDHSRWLRQTNPISTRELTMQRFFFNIRSGDDYVLDDDGEDCPTLQVAGTMALEGAKELLTELEHVNRYPESTSFEITDGNGRLMLRIPFTLAMHPGMNAADGNSTIAPRNESRPDPSGATRG